MPGVSGVTVVTTLVCFVFIAREAAGASFARHSLRPLIFGADVFGIAGRNLRRGTRRCVSSRHCERQRSNPLFVPRGAIDCIAYARNDDLKRRCVLAV
jgi:hypothetical protein